MSYNTIDLKVDEIGVATLTLNRPEALNTLTYEAFEELEKALDECGERNDVRAVLLTGAGRAFCAGDDINIMEDLWATETPEIARLLETAWPTSLKKMMRLPKPVIGAINGICLGAGNDLFLGCDLVVASEKAVFGHAYMHLALTGNTYLLYRYIGMKKATELIWSGRNYDAQEAYELGLVNKVVPEESLMDEAYKMARKYAKGPTKTYAATKRAMVDSLNAGIDEGIKIYSEAAAPLFETKDHRGSVDAFFKKEKYHFTGE